MAEIRVKTSERIELIDITAPVNDALSREKIESGLVNLFVLHTTSAIFVSENWDPDVQTDMIAQLETIVPRNGGYKHGEGNSQAHILSVMLGTSITLPVADGRLLLGRWQGVIFGEFDGPRDRTVVLTALKSD